MAAIHWTGAAGDNNWNNAANWSPAQVPGASDTVTISESAATLINISQADAAQALTTSAQVTLSVNDNSSLTIGNAATSNATLSNAGVIELNANNFVTSLIVGGPEVTLSGSGTIAMDNNGNNQITAAAATDELNNTNNTILGAGNLGAGALTFVNGASGIVDADLGDQLIISTGTIAVSNAGLLEATGNGGGLVIQSNINNGTGGHIAAMGGTVFLESGASVAGGTLSSTGTFAVVIANTATLNGATNAVTNTGTVNIQDNSTLTVLGGIVNQGQIALNNNNYNTDLVIGGAAPGTVTLTGSGTIALGTGGNNRIYGGAVGDTLVNQNNIIAGAGQLGVGTLTFVNDGTINATDAGALTVNTGGTAVINNALMEATGTGGLVLQTAVNDSGGGTILANGGNVYLNGGTLAGGTIKSSGGGSLVVSGGNIGTLDGSTQTVTNAGQVVVNDDGTLSLLGTVTNDGMITVNGNNYGTSIITDSPTVTLTGGGTILLNNDGNNRLYGASASDVLINSNNLIEGGGQLGYGQLTFTNAASGTVNANTSSQLVLNTGSTVTNAGLLEATAGSGGLVIQSSVSNGTAGRISAAGGNVYLQSGADIIGGTLSSSGGASILDSNSATLGALSGKITNSGTVLVQDDTTLTLLGTLFNKGALALDGNNYNTDLISGSGTNTSTVTLTGSGTISLDDNGNNRIYAAAAGDTLVNLNNTIVGAGQFGVDTGLILINDSTIDAVGSNRLTVNTGATVSNNAVMESNGVGGLWLQGTINSSGGGTILAAAGNVYLNGATLTGGVLNSQSGAAIVNTNSATFDGTTQTVTNHGVVSFYDGSTLTLLGTITNTGTIALNANNYNTDLIAGGATVTLTGGGTVLLDNNGNNRIYGTTGADVLVNVNNTIEGAGQLGTGQLTLVNDASGVIDANDTSGLTLTGAGTAVTNAGLIEATGSGGLTIETAVNSSTGGTVLANGGNVYLYGATIQGGLLATGANGGAFVVSGNSTIDGSSSTVTIAAASTVSMYDGRTLTLLGTVINLGSIDVSANNYNTDLIVGSASATLSGAGTILLDNSGLNRIYGSTGTDTLINVNNIIEGGGQIGAGQLTLVNQSAGIIDATDGSPIYLNCDAATNAGLIEATAGGELVVQSAVDSSSGGTILANGANVVLSGGTLAGGTVQSEAGGAVVISGSGTLDGSAHTLTNDALVALNDNATLTVLGAIANQGTIQINANNYYTDVIIGSPTLTLSGTGTIALDNSGLARFYGASAADVLDNVSNTIDGAGQLGAGQLTLVNSGIIEATDSSAMTINLGSTGTNTATGQLLGVGAGGLVLQNGTYTNLGTIAAENGSTVTFQSSAVLTNDNAGGTLTGGTYAAFDTGNDATLSVTGAAVSTLAATLELSGTGAQILFGGVTIDSSLDAISSGGTFDVLNDRDFLATANGGTFADNGVINLGGGTFTATQLTIGKGASFAGYGELDGKVVNNGVITIENGQLIFGGSVTGTGSITTGTGGIVVLDGGGSLNQAVSGTGTLELNSGTYTLAKGNTVSIANVDVASTASIVGAGKITSAVADDGSVTASGGKLILNGEISGDGTLAADSGATLQVSGGGTFSGMIEGPGKVHIGKMITLNNGTQLAVHTLQDTADIALGNGTNLTNMKGNTFTIGSTPPANDPRHRAEVVHIMGLGTGSFANTGLLKALSDGQFQVAFSNTGTVAVAGGTLGMEQIVSGAGLYDVSTGAVLDLAGGGDFAAKLQGAGTVEFDNAFTLDKGATLAASAVIATGTLTLGSGENVTNLAANTFTLADPANDPARHRAEVVIAGGSGAVFTNAGTVTSSADAGSFTLGFVNSGSVSASAGTLSFLGSATNTGLVTASGAEIDFSASVAGSGTLAIGGGGTLGLLAGSGSGQVVDFHAATGLLNLATPLNFGGTIADFGVGDQIDLVSTKETSYSVSNDILTVKNGNRTVAALHFAGTYQTTDFTLAGDGHGGTLITHS